MRKNPIGQILEARFYSWIIFQSSRMSWCKRKWTYRPIARKTRLLTNVTNQVSPVCCHLAGWGSNLQFLSSNWISYIRSKTKAHGRFPGDGASVSWIAEVGDNQSYVPVCPHSLPHFVQLSFSTANPYLQSVTCVPPVDATAPIFQRLLHQLPQFCKMESLW